MDELIKPKGIFQQELYDSGYAQAVQDFKEGKLQVQIVEAKKSKGFWKKLFG